MKGEIVQPLARHPIDDRNGNDRRNAYQLDKVAVEKIDDSPRRSSQDFANADFLCAHLDAKGRKAYQTQARNKDGQHGDQAEEVAQSLLRLALPLEVIDPTIV